MRIKGSRKKGLTLVEVLISLAILGIIVAPFFSLIITSTKITLKSSFKIKAVTLAQTVAEYIRNTEFDDIDLSEIMLLESDADKAVFLKAGDDPNKVLLYNVHDEEYKDMVVKIKYKWVLEDISKNSNGMSLYLNKSNADLFYNNSKIQSANYANEETLDVSINVLKEVLNNKLEIVCTQGGKAVFSKIIDNFNGNINLNFPVDIDPMGTKITAINTTESKINLNIYKNYNSNINYSLTTGENFTINNFASYNNSIIIKKGDDIEIEIYRFSNNKADLLQKLKITKVR
ncbi:prepilin-type N-terminal cleavage/methylation domain-containing protein [Clostridium sp.]|uniref:type IV pilus modification PilV family protein n=1 Tax=Clostridium sp. TaxID=1506 RepID=UPI002FC8379A